MLRLLICLLSLCLAAEVARAQSEPLDAQLRAAIQAYEAGRLDEARGLFEQLHAQAPTARTLRGLGVVAFRQGRFVEAIPLLEASASSQVKPLTPELRRAVDVVLAQARAQIGTVELTGLAPEAQVRVDGGEPPRDAQGALLLAPGAHALVIARTGHAERRHEIALQAGGKLALDASLTPLPAADPAEGAPPSLQAEVAAVPAAPPRPSRPVMQTRRGTRRAAYVLLGVGAAGLVTSLAATAAGIKRTRGIEDECRAAGGCLLTDAQEKYRDEKLDLLSALSIGGAVVGGTSAVTGLVLWLTVSRAERAPTTSGPSALLLQVRGSF